ncbi:MAG: rRNA maturation RNase YbeY [Sphingobacteriales bacterium]|nr:rRNA maturation RNase YbeY [Sphingobacteriales bacterium]MBI3720313.1 rRNA maturation RNase YbeY [Sphingobacteriales bacterium]
MGLVTFNYLVEKRKPKQVRILKRFLPEIFSQEGKRLKTINYIFCSDEYLLKINQKYLSHDCYTDIITFELNDKAKPVISDIYISVDRVRENAHNLNQNYQTELIRVIIHGALHLCGYKDKSKRDKELMRQKESHYINSFEYTFSRGTHK